MPACAGLEDLARTAGELGRWDFFFTANELFVADGYGNRRVAVFDAETGRFKRRWGAFGDTPVDDAQCQARRRARACRS